MLDTGITGGNEVQLDAFYIAGAQIPGVGSLLLLNFAQCCLTFVGPQYGIYFTPSFWCLEFLGGAHNLENLRPPAVQLNRRQWR